MKKIISLYHVQDAASNITVKLQEKSCRDFAEKKGWQIENEYIAAEGVSGTLDDPLDIDAFAKAQYKVDSHKWLSPKQCSNMIDALDDMSKRPPKKQASY